MAILLFDTIDGVPPNILENYLAEIASGIEQNSFRSDFCVSLIFEFFNRIGQVRPVAAGSLISDSRRSIRALPSALPIEISYESDAAGYGLERAH